MSDTVVQRGMLTVRTISEVRKAVGQARQAGRSVGFVPTMGALHTGHYSLITEARARCDFVVVSVFVNPTQFCPGEDLDAYPRDLEVDHRGCEDAGVDLLFAPEIAEVYPGAPLTTVTVSKVTAPLCGRYRPEHFDGVTTVVAKLFNIVCPTMAFFGEKDYQQLTVVRKMVLDLDMPVEVVGCPTVREADGLAVSSRNGYLDVDQRKQATCLYRSMLEAAEAVRGGKRDAAELVRQIERTIHAAGPATIDYVNVVDLVSLEDVEVVQRPVRICMAVRIGDCRLIDNIGVDVPVEGE